MKHCRIIISIFLTLFIASEVYGQFYYLGDDPSHAKWRKIKSANYTLVYPQEIDSLARRYLTLLEQNRPSVMKPLDINPKRLPVILHPYSTKSNGMVTWAPKRMELYTSPQAYSSYSQNWENHLIIHESRHVGQVSHFTEGIFKVFEYIIGEQFAGLALGVLLSPWSLEGDAVLAETELSKAGRGRSAEFLKYYRTAYFEKEVRDMKQWMLGSYYKYTPDHYAFGYYLFSSSRYFNDNNQAAGEFFSAYKKHWKSIKKLTAPKKNLLKGWNNYYDLRGAIWEEDMAKKGPTTLYDTLTLAKKKYHTEKISPVKVNDEVYFIKKGMYNNPTLCFVGKDKQEKNIRPMSYYINKLVPAKDRIYWEEAVSDPRWGMQSFSDLFYIDLSSKKVKRLTKNKKYFNPSVSKSGDSIAVAEYPIGGSSYLVILDSNGDVRTRVEAPNKTQIRETAFIGDDIFCTIVTNNGMGIYKYSHGKWNLSVADQHKSIERLRSTDSNLYFCSDLDGVLNIYSYEPYNQALWQLTNSPYGADYPHFNETQDTLLYSDYSLMGYNVASTNVDSLYWKYSSFKTPHKDKIAELISDQSLYKGVELADSIDYSDYQKHPSKKYNKLAHLFRIHSWAPIYYNIDNIRAQSYDYYTDLASLGATIYSQNSLGTATTMLAYSYSRGKHGGHFKFNYTGLYPVFEINYDFNTEDRFNYKVVHDKEKNKHVIQETQYNSPYMQGSLLAYIPFNLSSKGWNRGLIPQANLSFNNNTYYSYEKDKNILTNVLSYGIRYYQTLSMTANQIFPRWGFGVSAMGSNSIGTGELFGQIGYLYGYGYLPGITVEQGIKISAEYQHRFNKDKVYNVKGFANLPRGYQNIWAGDQFFKGTLDYSIPIYLHDYHLLSFLYLERLKLTPFVDFAHDLTNNKTTNYLSYGTSLVLDFNIFRYTFPFSIGVRYSRTGPQENDKRDYFNFIFDISF